MVQLTIDFSGLIHKNMKTVWSSKIDDILKSGHSLHEMGIRNWALEKEKALNAMTQFVELQVPILGGDVCELIDGIIQYNYDSWHCEPIDGEPKINFVARSVEKAKQYIESYKSKDPDKIFFAFVPGV